MRKAFSLERGAPTKRKHESSQFEFGSNLEALFQSSDGSAFLQKTIDDAQSSKSKSTSSQTPLPKPMAPLPTVTDQCKCIKTHVNVVEDRQIRTNLWRDWIPSGGVQSIVMVFPCATPGASACLMDDLYLARSKSNKVQPSPNCWVIVPDVEKVIQQVRERHALFKSGPPKRTVPDSCLAQLTSLSPAPGRHLHPTTTLVNIVASDAIWNMEWAETTGQVMSDHESKMTTSKKRTTDTSVTVTWDSVRPLDPLLHEHDTVHGTLVASPKLILDWVEAVSRYTLSKSSTIHYWLGSLQCTCAREGAGICKVWDTFHSALSLFGWDVICLQHRVKNGWMMYFGLYRDLS